MGKELIEWDAYRTTISRATSPDFKWHRDIEKDSRGKEFVRIEYKGLESIPLPVGCGRTEREAFENLSGFCKDIINTVTAIKRTADKILNKEDKDNGQ